MTLGQGTVELYGRRVDGTSVLTAGSSTGNPRADHFGRRLLLLDATPPDRIVVADANNPELRDAATPEEVLRLARGPGLSPDTLVTVSADTVEADARWLLEASAENPEVLGTRDRAELADALETGNPERVRIELLARIVVRCALEELDHSGQYYKVRERYRDDRRAQGVAASRGE